MRGSLETEPAACIQQQLALLKDVIAVLRLRSIEKHIPLHHQKRNVDGIEKRDCRQPPLEIRIDEREIRAHRATAILVVLGSRVATQEVLGSRIETEDKVVFDR